VKQHVEQAQSRLLVRERRGGRARLALQEDSTLIPRHIKGIIVALQATPRDRVDAALRWVKHDSSKRTGFLADMLVTVPAGLLSKKDFEELRREKLVQESYRARLTVRDMEENAARPYYQAETDSSCCGMQRGCVCVDRGDGRVGHRDVALDITDMIVGGGDNTFAWAIHEGNVEFTMNVVAAPCLRALKFTLRCVRVQVHPDCFLPAKVTASVVVKLCCSRTSKCRYHTERGMEVVGKAIIQGDYVTLVSSGRVTNFHKHFESLYCYRQVAKLINCKCNFAVFVQIKNMWVSRMKYE
jgi:hypothetical protein